MPRYQSTLEYLEDVVYNKKSGILASIVRCMLILLSWVYTGAISIYMLMLRLGIVKKHRLRRPIISVGNITVGGTGKTPTTQYIVRRLKENGKKPAILSYGYGGSLSGQFGVVSDGNEIFLNAKSAGDEPVMLAESLPGTPVLVCKHRHISGLRAIQDYGADVLVLDDGFQVWKLEKDLEIVLLSGDRPFDNRRTLPAGKLREPLSSLKRASCIIITGNPDRKTISEVELELKSLSLNIPTFTADYVPDRIIYFKENESMSVDNLKGMKVFALSSIGNPTSFEKTILSTGAEIVGRLHFEDHHQYDQGDMDFACSKAIQSSASLIVTTMKDAVKLKSLESNLPIAAISVIIKLSNEEEFCRLITNIVKN